MFLALGIYELQYWANEPVQREYSPSPAPSTSTKAVTATQPVNTKFFSFTLPADFTVRNTSESNDQEVHIQAFQATAGGQQVGITSSLLPNGGLKELADYHMRATSTQRYERVDSASLAADSQAFRSISDVPELTVFVMHGNRYITAALSSSSTDGLDDLMTTILKELTWH